MTSSRYADLDLGGSRGNGDVGFHVTRGAAAAWWIRRRRRRAGRAGGRTEEGGRGGGRMMGVVALPRWVPVGGSMDRNGSADLDY